MDGSHGLIPSPRVKNDARSERFRSDPIQLFFSRCGRGALISAGTGSRGQAQLRQNRVAAALAGGADAHSQRAATTIIITTTTARHPKNSNTATTDTLEHKLEHDTHLPLARKAVDPGVRPGGVDAQQDVDHDGPGPHGALERTDQRRELDQLEQRHKPVVEPVFEK